MRRSLISSIVLNGPQKGTYFQYTSNGSLTRRNLGFFSPQSPFNLPYIFYPSSCTSNLSNLSKRWKSNLSSGETHVRKKYPELDEPIKKKKPFNPIEHAQKLNTYQDLFSEVNLQIDPENDPYKSERFTEEEEDEERKIKESDTDRETKRQKGFGLNLGSETEVSVKKWSKFSYGQLLEALEKDQRKLIITAASLRSLKRFLGSSEKFVDEHRAVYKYGKYKQKDYQFKRNHPHTYIPPIDPSLDYPPPESEPPKTYVKTIMSESQDIEETSQVKLFRLPPMKRTEDGRTYAIGRRKSSTARCWLSEGSGQITVNDRPFDEYFRMVDRKIAIRPLIITETQHNFDLHVKITGGGTTGQSEAMKFAVSHCLLRYDPEYWWVLDGDQLLRPDKRRVEPKKYGRHKARRENQWVKR